MAAEESDAVLWLDTKLGSTVDLWSGKSICPELTRERLTDIQDCFWILQPHVKVKLLLSFLHLPRRRLVEWKTELDELIELASNDGDQWVSMISDIMRPYTSRQEFASEIEEHHTAFMDVLNDLKKAVKKNQDCGMLPVECVFLNKSALNHVTGTIPPPAKHFALKRKPKSAALRAEILQKSNEAASNTKRLGHSNSLPIRMRSFAKKMDDTSPMRGIPSRTPPSGGFRTPGAPGSSRFGGHHAAGVSTPLGKSGLKREGGIKLLDIGEQPVGGKEAKRRKRQADLEAMAEAKKEREAAAQASAAQTTTAANATPDYAAALMSPGVQTLSASSGSTTSVTPSYLPVSSRLTVPVSSTVISTQGGAGALPQQPPPLHHPAAPGGGAISLQLNQPVTIVSNSQNIPPAATSIGQNVRHVTPLVQQQQQQHVQQQSTTVQHPVQNPTQKKGLSLTREQMVEAQELFKHSNKVTRPEKALILGFMAGARENLCKEHGDVVNILLNQEEILVQQPDGSRVNIVTDTYFQMNYATGTWQKVMKKHQKAA